MDVFYDILNDMYDIEDKLQAMEYLLSIVENSKPVTKSLEQHYMVSFMNHYIKSLSKELNAIITRIDVELTQKNI